MATTLPPPSDLLQTLGQPRPAAPTRRPRRRWGTWLVILVSLGLVAGLAWLNSDRLLAMVREQQQLRILVQRAVRGPLIVSVTEDGNVESAANVDVKCQVAGGSVILTIVPDGTEVRKGDLIVELDSSTLEEQISQQKIVLEKAVAARIQVEKEFSAAKISVQEYLDGTFVKELQLLEANIKIADENLRSAQNTLQHTERLARKGYVTTLQLESQQFAVQRCTFEQEAAHTAKHVLIAFTKPKMLEDLESKRDGAEARMRSERAACDLEEQRLKRLESQIAGCKIYAPQDGMVIYANEQSSRMSSSSSGMKIEEGAQVRERQSIVRLPDLSKMQVKVLVHESKVEQVRIGQPAQIRWLDKSYTGRVTFVGNQPEPTSFFSSNVKEYAAFVRIDGEMRELRPGMTAEAEILIASLKDVISVPVQAVVEQGGKSYCWIKQGERVTRRPVVLGLSNSERLEIRDGLAEGDEVVLNPRAVVAEARDENSPSGTVDVQEKFGSGGAAPALSAEGAGVPTAATGVMPTSGDNPQRGNGPPTINFADLDKNGDQKITRDEIEGNERLLRAFDLIDTNKDDAISPSELSAMRSRMEAMKKQAGGPPPQ